MRNSRGSRKAVSKGRMGDFTSENILRAQLVGENPKVISERLGHATVNITLDTYSHVLPTMQKGAAEKLEKLLADKPEKLLG